MLESKITDLKNQIEKHQEELKKLEKENLLDSEDEEDEEENNENDSDEEINDVVSKNYV